MAAKEEDDFDPSLVPQSTLAYESRGAEILDPHVESMGGRRVNILVHGGEYIYTYEARFSEVARGVACGMLVKTLSGIEIGGAVSSRVGAGIPYVPAGSRFRVKFRFRCLLNPGNYFLNAGVTGLLNGEPTYLDRRIDVSMFRVKAAAEPLATGIVNLDVTASLAPEA